MESSEFWDALLAKDILCVRCNRRTKHRPSPLPTLSPYKDHERFDCTVCNSQWVLVKGNEVIHQDSGWKHDINFAWQFDDI